LTIDSGWDAGVSCAFMGLVVTKLKLVELEGVDLWYFGWGTAVGYTQITNGKFKRHPWLYKSEWSPKRRFCLVCVGFFTLLLWCIFLSYFRDYFSTPSTPIIADEIADGRI